MALLLLTGFALLLVGRLARWDHFGRGHRVAVLLCTAAALVVLVLVLLGRLPPGF